MWKSQRKYWSNITSKYSVDVSLFIRKQLQRVVDWQFMLWTFRYTLSGIVVIDFENVKNTVLFLFNNILLNENHSIIFFRDSSVFCIAESHVSPVVIRAVYKLPFIVSLLN